MDRCRDCWYKSKCRFDGKCAGTPKLFLLLLNRSSKSNTRFRCSRHWISWEGQKCHWGYCQHLLIFPFTPDRAHWSVLIAPVDDYFKDNSSKYGDETWLDNNFNKIVSTCPSGTGTTLLYNKSHQNSRSLEDFLIRKGKSRFPGMKPDLEPSIIAFPFSKWSVEYTARGFPHLPSITPKTPW